jgi:hypothetical protein
MAPWITMAKSTPKEVGHISRGLGGAFQTADGVIKGRNVLKAGAGVAGVGTAAWMLTDNKAGEKLGGAMGNVGSGFGGALSGLLSGLTEGIFGPWLIPGCGLCCCCCLMMCAIFAYMQMS